jgi:hypothetical protein
MGGSICLFGFGLGNYKFLSQNYYCFIGILFVGGDDFKLFGQTIQSIAHAFLPVPTLHHIGNWNSYFIHSGLVYLLLAIPILIICALLFWQNINTRIFWGVFLSIDMAFSYLVMIGQVRHIGFIYIGFLVSLWLIYSDTKKPLFAKWQLGFIYTILLVQIIAGLYMVTDQNLKPFTQSRETANFLKQNHYSHLPIYCIDNNSRVPIVGYLNKSVTRLSSKSNLDYEDWREYLDDVKLLHNAHPEIDSILRKGDSAIYLTPKPAPFIIDSVLSGKLPNYQKHVKSLAVFSNASIPSGNYYVYLIIPTKDSL